MKSLSRRHLFLAALVVGGGAGAGPARPWRFGAVGLTLLLAFFSGYRILVARRVGQELHETVSRPALWSPSITAAMAVLKLCRLP